jgi:hypothetical protein
LFLWHLRALLHGSSSGRAFPVPAIYRGWQHGNQTLVLAVALPPEKPSPENVRRLEHEYSLAVEPLSNLMASGQIQRADDFRETH